jgi:hypothetical protein
MEAIGKPLIQQFLGENINYFLEYHLKKLKKLDLRYSGTHLRCPRLRKFPA